MAGALTGVVAGRVKDDRGHSSRLIEGNLGQQDGGRPGGHCGIVLAAEGKAGSGQAGNGRLPGVGEDCGIGRIDLDVYVGGVTEERERLSGYGDFGQPTVLKRHVRILPLSPGCRTGVGGGMGVDGGDQTDEGPNRTRHYQTL